MLRPMRSPASSVACALMVISNACSPKLPPQHQSCLVTACRHPECQLVCSPRFFHPHCCCIPCWLRSGGVLTCLLSLATIGQSPLSGHSFQASGTPAGVSIASCVGAALSALSWCNLTCVLSRATTRESPLPGHSGQSQHGRPSGASMLLPRVLPCLLAGAQAVFSPVPSYHFRPQFPGVPRLPPAVSVLLPWVLHCQVAALWWCSSWLLSPATTAQSPLSSHSLSG